MPVFVALSLMFAAILLQADTGLFTQIESWLLTMETVFTNGYFLLAAIVVWGSWFRTGADLRYETGANFLAIGLLVAITPYVTSVVVIAMVPMDWIYGHGTAPYTLFFSLIPVTFLVAILREGNRRPHLRLRQENL